MDKSISVYKNRHEGFWNNNVQLLTLSSLDTALNIRVENVMIDQF